MPHLKAGNSEAAGIVGRSNDRNQVGAVRYMLVVKLHRNLVVTWRRGDEKVTPSDNRCINVQSTCKRGEVFVSTRLLSDVRDAARSIFTVVEGDLRPAGSLHSDGQTTSSRLSRPDAELSWQERKYW